MHRLLPLNIFIPLRLNNDDVYNLVFVLFDVQKGMYKF
jgi:hypothetical protein